MAFKLFGFEIKRKEKQLKSFAAPETDDGAAIVYDDNTSNFGAYGSFSGSSLDSLEKKAKDDVSLITQYREVAHHPEFEIAIDDIVNEAISYDENNQMVSIVLDGIDLPGISKSIKNKITNEFNYIYTLLDFQNSGYEIFKKWYIDGRIVYHIVIDKTAIKKGVQELRYIDPRKIKKVKNVKIAASSDRLTGNILNTVTEEYFIYSDDFMDKSGDGKNVLKISKDSIAWVTSGLIHGNQVISHIDKAIKPLNQFRILEDATIIYKVTRAPERRIFYINVGDLPRAKAEQYLNDMMMKYKNKIVYNTTDGTITNSKKIMTMNEDFWLPRNNDGKGTEIDTLPGGTGFADIDDLLFFQKKLYKALNVPASRLDQEQTFNVGRTGEITRDEIKFTKFINRLRNRFSSLFLTILEKHLILKGIITSDDWKIISNSIRFIFTDDSHFSELKDSEVRRARMEDASSAEEFIGSYLSRSWVRKNIFRFSKQQSDEIAKEIAIEKKNGEIEVDLDSDGIDDSVDSDVGNDGVPDEKQKPADTSKDAAN